MHDRVTAANSHVVGTSSGSSVTVALIKVNLITTITTITTITIITY